MKNRDEIVCDGISDLEKIKELLRKFIENNNKRKEYVEKALEIFGELLKQEEKKITNLFGKDSKAIEYFKRITDGEYVDINYDVEKRKIKVTKKDKTVLDVDQLSGGALDQLYFAIRLSLAEKLIGEKGFFILDDPFIKADPDRLEKLFEILKEFSQEGWQIVYFSSKGEIKDLYERKYQDVANFHPVEYLD